MIRGVVKPSGKAVVPLKVFAADRREVELEVIVDTGFSAFLALTRATMSELGWSGRQHARIALADVSIAKVPSTIVEVLWLGERRRVLAVGVDGPALIGMEMMIECRLDIEFEPGWQVTIGPAR